jgi:hypothetical protein
MGLKIIASSSLECHQLPTKFHENLSIVLKVISGGHTYRQTGDFISLLSFLGSRLKINSAFCCVRFYCKYVVM